MQQREAAIKRETDELKSLLNANTDLTRQDKELTEQLERLTREIHARLHAGEPTDGLEPATHHDERVPRALFPRRYHAQAMPLVRRVSSDALCAREGVKRADGRHADHHLSTSHPLLPARRLLPRQRGWPAHLRVHLSRWRRTPALAVRLRDPPAARDERSALQRRRRRGERIVPIKATFAEFARGWLAAQRHLRPATRERYRWALESHLIPSFGRHHLPEIREDDVARLIADLSADLRPSSVRAALNVLSRV
ncbi:MAG: hypothetical protein E6G10_25360, partial [Actinobacteria bacterium]